MAIQNISNRILLPLSMSRALSKGREERRVRITIFFAPFASPRRYSNSWLRFYRTRALIAILSSSNVRQNLSGKPHQLSRLIGTAEANDDGLCSGSDERFEPCDAVFRRARTEAVPSC